MIVTQLSLKINVNVKSNAEKFKQTHQMKTNFAHELSQVTMKSLIRNNFNYVLCVSKQLSIFHSGHHLQGFHSGPTWRRKVIERLRIILSPTI